jgi:carbon storage regulator CsrA
MLVLTRKLMEKLYIGDQISVTVVRLEGGQVRLGIDAPRSIPVLRAELKPRPAGEPETPVIHQENGNTAITTPNGTNRREAHRRRVVTR